MLVPFGDVDPETNKAAVNVTRFRAAHQFVVTAQRASRHIHHAGRIFPRRQLRVVMRLRMMPRRERHIRRAVAVCKGAGNRSRGREGCRMKKDNQAAA